MSEENVATPAAEHASIGENGVIMLSEEAMDAMEHVEAPDVPDVHIEEATPAPVVETPAPAARKIKHNGTEVEVAPEQEIELMQKGYNYGYQMEQLAAERARLEPYRAIEANPQMKQKIAALMMGAEVPAPVAPVTPQFDDPIEQLKWETRQEVMREVEEKFMRPMQQQTQQNLHMQEINTMKQHVQADPRYTEVQAEIIKMVKALPASVGKNLYAQLDQDPRSYMEMFNSVKERLPIKPVTTPQNTEVPEPTKRETKAPLLETGSNNAPEASEQVKQNERIKELTKKSKAGDFRATGELMSLMA